MKPTQKIDKVNWSEQFKIRLRRNASKKHEHTKLSIVLSLIEKHRKNKSWIRIYTEHELTNNDGKTKVADVYFEDIKTNSIICYEIQNNISDKWMKETQDFYDNFERIYFTTDWLLVKEKELVDDIEDLYKQIEEMIV